MLRRQYEVTAECQPQCRTLCLEGLSFEEIASIDTFSSSVLIFYRYILQYIERLHIDVYGRVMSMTIINFVYGQI